MKQEKDIINEILLRASERGHRLFRSNTGRGWVGKVVRRGGARDDTVTLREARPLIAGLCVGAPDVQGFTSMGRWVGFEVKTPGVRVTPEQKRFIEIATGCGCIAAVVLSADEAMALLP